MAVISIIGAIHGAGTTTFAANLATIMAEETNTLLIDFSRNIKGGVLIPLGLVSKVQESQWANLNEWKKNPLLITNKNLAVLPDSERVEQITPVMIDEILNFFFGKYENIILDLGCLNWSSLSLENSIKILITEPSEKCMAVTDIPFKVDYLVVNNSTQSIYHPRDVIRKYNVEKNYRITKDIAAVKKAIKEQVPIICCSKKVYKQYKVISDAILEIANTISKPTQNMTISSNQPVVIMQNGVEAILNYVKKPKKPVTIINACPDSMHLPYKLGITPERTWQHDWRIRTAMPFKVNRKVEIYTIDRDDDIEKRDAEVLKELINLKKNRQIIINTKEGGFFDLC